MKKIIASTVVATLIIVSLAFFTVSCKKNTPDETPPAYLQFSAEALAYVQLPLNKYFIYKDSATATLDSVVVTKSSVEKIMAPAHQSTNLFDPNVPAFYYQLFTLQLTKYTGASQQDWFYGMANSYLISGITPVNSDTAFLLLRERDRINNADRNYVFGYPVYTSNGSTLTTFVLPTITLEGKTYANVVVYIAANGLDATQNYYLKSIYYWAKGIGIIKREVQTNSSIKTDLLVRNN